MIYAGAAADVIKAGDGNNTIHASEGDNFVFTGTGSDLIYAGSGNDVIFGGAGNDTIYAGEGNNFISAGTGNDTVYAGSGSDRFELVTGEGSVTIIGFGSNDKIHLGEELTSDALSFITQNGDTLVKVGEDLLATLKWTQLSSVAIDDAPAPISIESLPTSPNPSFNVGSGVFTVGSTGQVEIDYLFDSGAYEGELALFSLSGLTTQLGSDEFIKEATRRALSDSELGHVVIRDRVEGARFHGSLNEFAFNTGNYTGVEPVVMRPGDLFGLMLIPNGTVQQVFNQDPGSETSQPLFSLTAGNLDNVQFVNISDTGNVYALEDLSINGESDFDYNDLIFQIRGATGQVTNLDQLIAAGVTQPQQDWRNSTLGQAIVDYAKPYTSHSTPQIGETLSERVLAMLDQAADTQPTKVRFDSSADPTNQSIINDWVKTATERLSRVTVEGQSIISGISDSLPNSQSTLYQQILGLYDGLSSDTEYLNAWKNYWGSELGRLKTVITAQVSELRGFILESDDYLYQWAQYTANEINSTSEWLDEWISYAENEINRIDALLSQQIDAVSEARGTSDYNNLVSQINTTINGATESFWNERDAKNTVVKLSVDVFEAFDNYRVSSVDKAWKDYLALDNEQSSILSSIQSQLSSLGQYVDSVLSEAWNQYQELDRIRLQVIDDAVNQANFLSYAWNDLTGDTQDLIDVWAKIASQPNNWYSPSATPEQKSGLPLIGIIDTEFWASNPDIDYSRVVLGKDRIEQDDNPLVEPFEGQGNPHGTQVLEIIAATRNNGIGIDGINDRSPIWLGSALGSADWAQSLIEFVDAAIVSKQPNAVINLSFDLTQTNADGSVTNRYELTPLERAALTYAQQNQVLIVTAAGNQAGSLSALGQATKEFDNILVIGAADGLNRADYSGYGSIDYEHYGKGIDILAQGVASNGAVGTSIAAAKVTGAASLVWAANPELNYTQVSDILKRTATDIDTVGWDAATGMGLLNISAAANLAATVQAQPYTSPNLDAIQTALASKGIPEATWPDFYRFAYYQELEAKLTGQSWNAVDAVSSERHSFISREDIKKGVKDFGEGAKDVGGAVVDTVGKVLFPPPTEFGGSSKPRSGSGGSLNRFSKLISAAKEVVSDADEELKQVISETAAAASAGKTILVDSRDNFRDTVIPGVTNLTKTVESTKALTKAALQSVETVANNSTSAVIETASRINSSVVQYGDRIGDEARAVGDRIETGAKDLKQLYDENQQYLILVNPGAVIGVAIAEGLINSVKEGEVGPVLDTLKKVPVLGTAVAGVEGLYNAAQGDWEKVLTNAIQSALAFYGLTNIPGLGAKFIDLYVSVAWELKDEDYKGAVAEVLDKFGVDGKYKDASGKERRIADVFVNSAWAMKDGDFKEVIDAGLSTAGFAGADRFIDIAWGVKDGNYQKALTAG